MSCFSLTTSLGSLRLGPKFRPCSVGCLRQWVTNRLWARKWLNCRSELRARSEAQLPAFKQFMFQQTTSLTLHPQQLSLTLTGQLSLSAVCLSEQFTQQLTRLLQLPASLTRDLSAKNISASLARFKGFCSDTTNFKTSSPFWAWKN